MNNFGLPDSASAFISQMQQQDGYILSHFISSRPGKTCKITLLWQPTRNRFTMEPQHTGPSSQLYHGIPRYKTPSQRRRDNRRMQNFMQNRDVDHCVKRNRSTIPKDNPASNQTSIQTFESNNMQVSASEQSTSVLTNSQKNNSEKVAQDIDVSQKCITNSMARKKKSKLPIRSGSTVQLKGRANAINTRNMTLKHGAGQLELTSLTSRTQSPETTESNCDININNKTLCALTSSDIQSVTSNQDKYEPYDTESVYSESIYDSCAELDMDLDDHETNSYEVTKIKHKETEKEESYEEQPYIDLKDIDFYRVSCDYRDPDHIKLRAGFQDMIIMYDLGKRYVHVMDKEVDPGPHFHRHNELLWQFRAVKDTDTEEQTKIPNQLLTETVEKMKRAVVAFMKAYDMKLN